MTCGHIPDHRTEEAVLSFKPVLILQKKIIEVMKKHSIENSTFRMTLMIDLCHSSRDDSRNGPGWRIADMHPYKRPSLIQALFGRMSTEVDVGKHLCRPISQHGKSIFRADPIEFQETIYNFRAERFACPDTGGIILD
jgi:hypothetical protein